VIDILGKKIKDNSPRGIGRILIVEQIVCQSAHCRDVCSGRPTRIILKNIYTDGTKRRSGFSLVK
jgi:hypothetical protein